MTITQCPSCGTEFSIEGPVNVVRVRIDGVETTLTYDSYSGARGHQYLTPGNVSSHAFDCRLLTGPYPAGTRFRYSGHDYEVLGRG